MITQAWWIVLRGGLADPAGYPPASAAMIVSHRLLRDASPLLHVVALAASLALSRHRLYALAAAAQGAVLAAAAAGARLPSRPLLIARYYVLTTASIAAGLADYLRSGAPQGWDAPEGTR
jgi:hypothetical protein